MATDWRGPDNAVVRPAPPAHVFNADRLMSMRAVSAVASRTALIVNQQSRLRRLSGEAVWVAVGQALAAAGSIVGIRLLTGVLSPTAYGEVALGMTAAVLVQQSLLGPLSGACLRYFAPAQEQGALRPYLRATVRLLGEATAVFAGLAAFTMVAFSVLGRQSWLGLAAAAGLFALILGYGAALDGVQNAARQRVVVAWHQGLIQWLRPLSALLVVSVLGATGLAALLGFVMASAIVLASQLLLFRMKILADPPPTKDTDALDAKKYVATMRSYAWPFATFGVLTWLQLSSDRWALELYAGTANVGVYSVAYQLGYAPIAIIGGSVLQLVSPVLFSRAGDGRDPARLRAAFRLNDWIVALSIVGSIAVAGLAAAFHRQVFAILVAPGYAWGSLYLPPLVLSGGLFLGGQAASLVFMINTNTKALVAPKIGSAILGVLFNVVGARALGVGGVVLASLAFSATYLLWILALVVRYRRRLTS